MKNEKTIIPMLTDENGNAVAFTLADFSENGLTAYPEIEKAINAIVATVATIDGAEMKRAFNMGVILKNDFHKIAGYKTFSEFSEKFFGFSGSTAYAYAQTGAKFLRSANNEQGYEHIIPELAGWKIGKLAELRAVENLDTVKALLQNGAFDGKTLKEVREICKPFKKLPPAMVTAENVKNTVASLDKPKTEPEKTEPEKTEPENKPESVLYDIAIKAVAEYFKAATAENAELFINEVNALYQQISEK